MKNDPNNNILNSFTPDLYSDQHGHIPHIAPMSIYKVYQSVIIPKTMKLNSRMIFSMS